MSECEFTPSLIGGYVGTPRISFARPAFRLSRVSSRLYSPLSRLRRDRGSQGARSPVRAIQPHHRDERKRLFFHTPPHRRTSSPCSPLYPGCPRAYTRLRQGISLPQARKGLGHPYEQFNPTAVTSASACFFIRRRIGERARPVAAYEKRHLAVSFVTVVGLNRLELSTSRLSGACSNQLSYNPVAGASLAGVVEMHGFEPRTS